MCACDLGGGRRLVCVRGQLDADGSGTLSFKELRSALSSMDVRMTAHSMKQLWSTIDTNGDGEIYPNEFIKVRVCHLGDTPWRSIGDTTRGHSGRVVLITNHRPFGRGPVDAASPRRHRDAE